MNIGDIRRLSNHTVRPWLVGDRLYLQLERAVSIATFKAFMLLGMHLGRVEGKLAISLPANAMAEHETEMREVLHWCELEH